MEFRTQQELYNKLLPVFKVKKRLMLYSGNIDIKNEDIWLYLVNSKWKNSYNLTLSEIVNDIITVDLDKIVRSND